MNAVVARHRTALHRADLSRPVKAALESGLLAPGRSFFDYGCGHGGDIERLRALGYAAAGWDPHHRPDAPRTAADVVNLGFVLNVIEDPAERPAVLREAFAQTGSVLLVSALLRDSRPADDADAPGGQPFRDGVLTRLGTFQKRFDQGELQTFIETALGTDALPVEPGVFAVFRHPEDLHGHLAARVRRRVDWDELRARLGLALPPRVPRERRPAAEGLPEQHPDLFTPFRDLLLDLGRSPAPGEFPREAELLALPGLGRSLARAVRVVLARPGVAEAFTTSRELRRGDHLVFLALANLARRPASFRQLPLRVREDVRAFHGPDWPRALARGRELLFAAGDPGEITLACDEFRAQAPGGWEDPDDRALTVHRSLLPALPPLLRVFAHCAAHRYGDPARADLIRLHKHSGKVSFLYYDRFDTAPFPALRQRIKVNLRTLFVQVFDYAGDADPDDHAPPTAEVSLLPFKERFLPRDHPRRPAMARASARLRRAGWDETNVGHGLTPGVLAAAGINVITRTAASRLPRKRATADRRKPA